MVVPTIYMGFSLFYRLLCKGWQLVSIRQAERIMIAYPIDCQSEKLEKFWFFRHFLMALQHIDLIEKNSKKACSQINVALQPKALFDVLFRAHYF